MSEPLDTNPKTRLGQAKPGIYAIPPSSLLHCGRAMEDGEQKYGLMNWREHEVSASVYYNAAFRHMAAWWEGEECASDSGVHHLGHVMACCAILLDAQHKKALNDNRPSEPGEFSELVAEMTRPMETPEPIEAIEAIVRPGEDPLQVVAWAGEEAFDGLGLDGIPEPDVLGIEVESVGEGEPGLTDDEIEDMIVGSARDFVHGAQPDIDARLAHVKAYLSARGFASVDRIPVTHGEEFVDYLATYGLPVEPPKGAVAISSSTMDQVRVFAQANAEITQEDLQERARAFLLGGPNRLAIFGSYQNHMGVYVRNMMTQAEMTRLAVYMAAEVAGLGLSPAQIDVLIES